MPDYYVDSPHESLLFTRNALYGRLSCGAGRPSQGAGI